MTSAAKTTEPRQHFPICVSILNPQFAAISFRNKSMKWPSVLSFVSGYRSIYLLHPHFPPIFIRQRNSTTIFTLNRSPAVR
jgi:hypothetical protein